MKNTTTTPDTFNSSARQAFLGKLDLTPERAQEMSPWDIAEQLGIHYTGDMDPFNHGGAFYSSANWKSYGYASAVRFQQNGDTVTEVDHCVINRPDDMAGAFECCDVQPEDRDNPLAQIECSLLYCGTETEQDFDGDFCKRYNEESEERAWEDNLDAIIALASE